MRARNLVALAIGLCCGLATSGGTNSARASGDTRTLTFFHTHTKESATVTFWRDGNFDAEGLSRLNWFLRDWRVNEPARMDPQLFNALWEIYREVGSREPINIISAYRSPQTNAMLRNRSKAVSEQSQHMMGKAMDIRLPDVETDRLRAAAMRMQYGGVGFYPSSAFVHVDTGSVRAWPRMSQDQLARLFPDGKTVHLPSNGKLPARYEEAKVELLARKTMLASSTGAGNPLTGILGALFRQSNPTEGGDGSAVVTTASLPVELRDASPTVPAHPLPPRRPVNVVAVDLGLAPRGATPPAIREQPPSEHRTAASKLLFAPTQLSAQMPAESDIAYVPAPESQPGWHVTANPQPIVVQTFTRQSPASANALRFTGSAVDAVRSARAG